MLSFVRELFVTENVWFSGTPKNKNADIIRYRQFPSLPLEVKGDIFHTLVIALSKDEESLWNSMGKTSRYKIRRAEREGANVLFDQQNDKAKIKDFISSYELMSQSKGISPLNYGHIINLQNENMFELTMAVDKDGVVCSWHAYVIRRGRARLLFSVSELSHENTSDRRAFLGRTNRLHHWRDIQRFRAAGFRIYDFGGWYAGKEDKAKLQINTFKESFGGVLESSYNATIGSSWKGRLVLALWRVLKKFKRNK